MDSQLLIICALWIISVLAFIEGITSYPFGWLVLGVLFFARLSQLMRS